MLTFFKISGSIEVLEGRERKLGGSQHIQAPSVANLGRVPGVAFNEEDKGTGGRGFESRKIKGGIVTTACFLAGAF